MSTTVTLAALVIAAIAVLLLLLRIRQSETALDELAEQNQQSRTTAQTATRERDEALLARDAVFRISTEPTIFVNTQKKILLVNDAAEALGLFQTGHSLIESTRSFEFDALADEALHNGSDLPREIMLNNKLYRARVAKVDAGAVIALRDVSELARLGRARRDFVANISHELRTPLAAIRLLLDTIRLQSGGVTTEQQRLLDQIGGQTSELSQMAQELSDLAQIESGQMPMRMITYGLRESVDGVIERQTPQAQHAGLTLINNIAPSVHVLADPAQIQRVLANLMNNAIKFTERGSVSIDAIQDGIEWVRVSVQDTGVGIPADELPRIFERFYKIDRARGQSGTGLGLAIAKHIIEAHGGRIWAESTLGVGTTFFVTLPAGD